MVEKLLLHRNSKRGSHETQNVPSVSPKRRPEVVRGIPQSSHGLVLILIQIHRDEAAEAAHDEALDGEGAHGEVLVKLREEAVETQDVERAAKVA